MIDKIKGWVSGIKDNWSTLELSWISIFLVINMYLFFAFGDTLLGLVSSTTGVLCVVAANRGKMSTYYFGIVQASTYAYIAWQYGLFGEAMLNGLFYLPMQFIGIYFWSKARTEKSVIGEDVKVKRLNKKQIINLSLIAIVSSIGYAFLLDYIGGQQVRLDSVAVVLSVIAQFLMLKRYVEQWVVWITVNVLTITLWIIVLVQQGGNDWNMVLMWIAFLFNSIIGYRNWSKMHKGQKEMA